MDGRPSFRRRRDALRLLLALAAPWVLLAVAYAAPLLDRALVRAGRDTSWMSNAPLVWFYGFGFPALFSLAAAFLLGIFRLAWWREYRRPWYGWAWLVSVWLNLCGLGALMDSGVLPK